MSFRISWRVTLCLATSILAAVSPPAYAEPPQFEEPLELFDPKEVATEKERDQAQALTFFGMAREAEARGDNSLALRWFQRALRYDPSCIPAARAAMRLAIQLQQPNRGVDASLRLSACEDEDRLPLRYMALHLTQQGRWEDAVDLYERTLGIKPLEPTSEEDLVMMMEMARLCRLIEDNEKAACYFTEALKALETPRRHNISPKVKRDLLGEDGATYQLIGSCFLAAGNVQAAETVFKKAQEAEPNAARTALNAASIHHHLGRFGEALKELDLCLKSHTDQKGMRALLLLEETLNELGRGGELVDYLASLHEKQPENTTLAYFLAQKCFESKQFDRAEQLYGSLLDKSPTSTAYQHLLEIYLSRSDYVKVAGVLAAVAEKTGTLDALGESLGLLTASAEAVDAVLALGEESSAADDEAHRSRTLAAALIALAAERFDSAKTLMTAVIATSPDRAENLLLIWGVDLLSADHNAEAARVLRDGAEREGMSDEQRAVFYYYLAAALELDGQSDAALDAARKAVTLSEDSPPFHVRVAWVLYHADRKAEAAREYRTLIDRFDDQEESEQARNATRQARMVLSTMCVSERRIEEAVEWLEQVLDEFPDDPGALNDLGYLWADENQHLERAYGMILRAVEAEPENAAYHDSLGWVLYRKGQYQEAVAELVEAAEMEPDPVVLDHLGDAYSRTSQVDQAKATWKRAAEKFEEADRHEEAAKVRKKLAEEE